MGKILVTLLYLSVNLGFAQSFREVRSTTDTRSAPTSAEVPRSSDGAQSRPVLAFTELAAQATAARKESAVARAQDLYRQAVALKPDWAEGWFFLGSLSYDADQYDSCRESFQRFVALDAKTAPGWAFLGLCEFETGDYGPALRHLQQSKQSAGTELPPEMLPAVAFHEAQLLTHAGLFDQALEEYITMAQQGSHSPLVLTGLGEAALRAPLLVKDVPTAEENKFAAAGAAVYLWIAGQLDLASKAFGGFVDRFGDGPNVHCLYGTYLLANHPEQARMEFERELKTNPGCAQARALLAQQLHLADEEEQAFAYAERAALDGSSVPLAQYIYGLLLTRRGELKQGLPRLETAVKLDPANLEYHLALGDVYSKSGRVEDARRERLLSVTLAKGNS